YAAHQINLQPRVSLPETTPTLRWTGKVCDASAFCVWGSRAFVRDTTADKLSSHAVPCVFLGFPTVAPGWQFYHPTLRLVLSSQDVTFDESVSFYHPAKPVEVVVDSGATRGAEPAGAESGGAGTGGAEPESVEPGGAESRGAESGGAESGRAEPRGAEPGSVEPEGAVSGGAEPARAASGVALDVPLRREPLSPQELREWFSRRCRGAAGAGAAGVAGGAIGAGGAAGAGAAGGAAGAGAAGGAAGAGAAGGTAGARAAGAGVVRSGLLSITPFESKREIDRVAKAPRPLGPLASSTSAPRPHGLSAPATAATATTATAPATATTATASTAAPLLLLLLRLLLLLPSLSRPLPPRTSPSLPAMTSLRRSGGSGDGGGGSSGSGGGHPSSRCRAVRWGVSGGGQMRVQQRQHEALAPQQLHEWYTSRGSGNGSSGSRSAAVQLGVTGGGLTQLQRRPHETLSPQQLREWYVQRGASRGSARCPYVICTGDQAGQTCGTVGHTQSRCFSCLSDNWRAEFGDAAELPRWLELVRQGVDIFTLDYDAILTAMYASSASAESDCSRCVPPDPGIAAATLGASDTTLTPLPAPVPVRLADPSGGPVVACSSTVLPCLAVPSGSLSGLHLPSFSTNLVSTTALQDALITTTTPGGSSLYTLATSAQVSTSGQVGASCLCRLLSHQTLLWHHRLGHPSLPRLRGMHSRLLVSGLPRSLPPLPPLPAPPYLPCVEGRQRAAPHSSFPPTTAPLQTLHMDVWGPACVSGQGHECYFLLVVDDYTRYTTVFPLRSKGEVVDVLIPWIRTVHLQLRERIGQDLPVLRLHSDRGDLWPRFSLPETSPTLRWTGEVDDASVFRVWGSRAFVRDTSADKLSARAIPCVFLGFVPDAPGWQFCHPTSRRILPSQDVTFDESVPFYRLFPYRSAPPPPRRSSLLPVDPLPGSAFVEVAVGSGAARGAASGGAEPQGARSEGAGSGGAEPGGEEPGGAEPEGVEPGGAESEGAESWGAEPRARTPS
ncbi:unnamed protein product, partial [Closterium sp. NIES-53]